MISKVKNIGKEFPNTFWILTLATFIDRMGGFLLFPFFSIYLMQKFDASFTQVGLLFMMMSIGSLFGSLIGGAITDKIGRKKIIIFGLVVSGLGSVILGLVNSMDAFYILASILGLLGDIGGPARQAMIPDILPKEKHTQGFALLRIATNISATIGPILGGFIAEYSFMVLFIADAVTSLITAIIVLIVIPETKPILKDEKEKSSFGTSLKGYLYVLKDKTFMIYIAISVVMILVYMQMYSTLSVYLVDQQGFDMKMVGALMSLNAAMVVTLQFWVTRKLSKIALLKIMALGTFCYGIGFGMFGIVNSTILIFIAMAIVSFGEMIALPTSQGVAAKFAPEDKRGRYMAVFGFSWAIPNLFGVLLAGKIMDTYNPNYVWYGCSALSLIAILGFLLLHKTNKARFEKSENLEISIDTNEVTPNLPKVEVEN